MSLGTMQQRRGVASLWASQNPVLAQGELGIDLTALAAKKPAIKVGDGATAWNDLPFDSASSIKAETVTTASTTPLVLTASSDPVQTIIGAAAQPVLLPTGVTAGYVVAINNSMTGLNDVTVKSSNGSVFGMVPRFGGSGSFRAVVDNPTTPLHWVSDVRIAGSQFTVAGAAAITITNNGTASSWALPSGGTPTASALAQWDVFKSLSSNAFIRLQTTAASSATPVALSYASTQVQTITGTTQAQTMALPGIAIPAGYDQLIINAMTTASITVNGFSSGLSKVIPPGTAVLFTSKQSGPTLGSHWAATTLGDAVNFTAGVSGQLPVANGGTGASTAAAGLAALAPTGIPNALLPDGINNVNSAPQFVGTVAATNVYLTNSQLALPATYLQGMVEPSGSGGAVKPGTAFKWRVVLTKNGNGTGSFAFLIFRGTSGTTADTADVSQAIGTMTAVNDTLVLDIQVSVLTTGATGSYYWTITAVHSATSTSGFGLGAPTGAPAVFSGTVTGVAMNTASLVFGLGFVAGAGGTMPNVQAPVVQGQAFNID